MRKAIVGVLAVAVLAAILIVAFQRRGSISARPRALRSVTINEAFEHLLYIGLYVAKDAGFFEKQGLDVRIATGGGDAQAFSALTAGNAQFAQGDPAFVAIGAEKGWDGRVIVMAVDRVAMWGITFQSTIKSCTYSIGFKGRTVVIYSEPNTSYVVQKQLDLKAGLRIGIDTRILQVPFGTELATLQNKRADIAHTIEPNVSQVEAQGGRVVFSYPDAWGPLAFTGVMTSEALIDKDPQLVQEVVTGYEQAFRYVQTNFDETVKIAARRLPNLPPTIIRAALTRLVTSGCIPPHAKIDPESWRKLLQVRVDVGDLKQFPTKTLIDNRFAEAATRVH
jgi:NitT/TauT family transport system substrate-binding protein